VTWLSGGGGGGVTKQWDVALLTGEGDVGLSHLPVVKYSRFWLRISARHPGGLFAELKARRKYGELQGTKSAEKLYIYIQTISEPRS
jgi:hypothetical protein